MPSNLKLVKIIDKVNRSIEQAISDNIFPGCNYAFLSQKETYRNSLGYRAVYPNKEANTLDTIYDLASLTKVVAATSAVLKLTEDNHISLEEEVCSYLPFVDARIKINHLLFHNSGLPVDVKGAIHIKDKDELANKIQAIKLLEPPGYKVCYSDIGMILLGWLIERITGSYEGYIKEQFFDKLEMVDTSFNPKDKKRCAPTEDNAVRGIIRGEVHDEKAYALGGISGHAGLFSTIDDLSKFCLMLLNEGSYKGKHILSKELIHAIYNNYVKMEPDTYRALGWILMKNKSCLYHTGFTGTSIWIDRRNQFSFILLTNRVHPSRENTKIIECRKNLIDLIYQYI